MPFNLVRGSQLLTDVDERVDMQRVRGCQRFAEHALAGARSPDEQHCSTRRRQDHALLGRCTVSLPKLLQQNVCCLYACTCTASTHSTCQRNGCCMGACGSGPRCKIYNQHERPPKLKRAVFHQVCQVSIDGVDTARTVEARTRALRRFCDRVSRWSIRCW